MSLVLVASAMTLVAAGGMGRLFQGLTYLAPVLIAGATAHLLAALWRRLGLRTAASIVASVLSSALIGVWLVLPTSTWYGLPVGRTLGAVHHAMAHGVGAFRVLSAPAPALPGFLLVAVWAVAAAAIAADALLCRAGAPLEACLPSFVLFVFTAALGAPSGRALTTALYLAAVAGFVLTLEVQRRTSFGLLRPEPQGERRPGPGPPGGHHARRLLGAGAALGALAVVVATLAGPHLPGASSPALVSWHPHRTVIPGRTAESPLVSLKAELLSPPAVQVFSVAASQPSYWRLTSLDHFNGTVWSSTQAYQKAAGPLTGRPRPGAPDPGTSMVRQTYRITGLASAWLPAAFRAVDLTGVVGAEVAPSSSSLLSPSTTSPGMTYTVESLVPDLDAAELAKARVDSRAPGVAADLQLPSTLPPKVVRLARQVVAGKATPYAKALALQDFFRDNFTYSLSPPADSSDSALLTFLFRTRTGYCQQFAGAYAVLARAVGLPTRVAIGFTPGQLGQDGRYQVLALDAHAWPEVWLGRYGWVPFEPTPGRGEPGAEAYTGVPPEQAQPGDVTASLAPSTTAHPASTPAANRPGGAQPPRATHGGSSPAGRAAPGHGRGTSGGGLLPTLVGPLAAAAVILAGALAWPWFRRARRRAGARGADRVVVAFTEATEALARWGVARGASETFGQYARRATPRCPPEAGPPLARLALAAETAVYGRHQPRGEDVASAVSASRSVRRALRGRPGGRRARGEQLKPGGGSAPGPGP